MNNMASNMFTEVHSLLRQKRNQRKAEGIQYYQFKQRIFSSNQAVVNFCSWKKFVAAFFNPYCLCNHPVTNLRIHFMI